MLITQFKIKISPVFTKENKLESYASFVIPKNSENSEFSLFRLFFLYVVMISEIRRYILSASITFSGLILLILSSIWFGSNRTLLLLLLVEGIIPVNERSIFHLCMWLYA